jgi:hypothetical protein
VSDQTPAASHSVGASHLSLVTLELRGQSRNSLLQLAALPLDRHEAVFAANNCFLIAATCVGKRVGASVMLSGYSSHRRQAARSSGAVFDVGADRPWR